MNKITKDDLDADFSDYESSGRPVAVIGHHTVDGKGDINGVEVKNFGKKITNDYATSRVELRPDEQYLIEIVNNKINEKIATEGMREDETRVGLVHQELLKAVQLHRSRKVAAAPESTAAPPPLPPLPVAEQDVVPYDWSETDAANQLGPNYELTKPEFPEPVTPKEKKKKKKKKKSKVGVGLSMPQRPPQTRPGLESLDIPQLGPEPFSPQFAEVFSPDDTFMPIRFPFHWGINDEPEKVVLIYDQRAVPASSKTHVRLRDIDSGAVQLRVGTTQEELASASSLNIMGISQVYEFGCFIHYVFLLAD